jgi:hypothetical protein
MAGVVDAGWPSPFSSSTNAGARADPAPDDQADRGWTRRPSDDGALIAARGGEERGGGRGEEDRRGRRRDGEEEGRTGGQRTNRGARFRFLLASFLAFCSMLCSALSLHGGRPSRSRADLPLLHSPASTIPAKITSN